MVKYIDKTEDKMYFAEITMAVYATLFCAAVFGIIGETAKDLKNTDFMFNCLNSVMTMGISIVILMVILVLRITINSYEANDNDKIRKCIVAVWSFFIIVCGILILMSSYNFVSGLSRTLAAPIDLTEFFVNAIPSDSSLKRAVSLPETEEQLRTAAEEVRRLNEETRQTAEQIRAAEEEARAVADEQRQLLQKMLDTVQP
jgi:methyl-accepting chemotaxis protein